MELEEKAGICCGNCIFFHELSDESSCLESVKNALCQFASERSPDRMDKSDDAEVMQIRMKNYHVIRGERLCKCPPTIAFSTTDCTNKNWFMHRGLFNF